MAVTGWNAVRRVLAVRLDAMGDVLMVTPAVRALRQTSPGRTVTLLASPSGAEAARLVPEVDDVLVFEAPWMKATPRDAPADGFVDAVRRVREGGFDAAVIFTTYTQSALPAALLCQAAEVPLRLAYCRENPYQLLTDWVPETEPETTVRHEVRRQLDLVGRVGARTHDERLSVRVPPEAGARVDRLLADIGLSGTRRWLVVHPGATAPSRRWPASAYAEVVRRLAASGWGIVLTGSDREMELVDRIRADAGRSCRSLAGRLSLAELAAVLARAPLLVANNTGPVHLAAAVGTRVVDLYALTNPQHTPWGVASRVLFHDVECRNCYRSVCPERHHACLRNVAPDAVVRAVDELLAEGMPR